MPVIDPVTRRFALALVALPAMGVASSVSSQMSSQVVNVNDFGAKGDGIADDTSALSRAHASGHPVYYPFTRNYYRISRTINIVAGAYADGATIRIEQDGSLNRSLFRIEKNKAPIVISGFVLDGGYSGGTSHPFSMGIDLRGASNIIIENNVIKNLYGDCIYIGSTNDLVESRNIEIRKNQLHNPRRCNIAVVCGNDITISANLMTKPIVHVAAIDLEPDTNGFDYIRNIKIINNQFNTSGVFLKASVSNETANSGLIVKGNVGKALQFFHADTNARVTDATIARNSFAALSPGGGMLVWSDVSRSIVSENVDRTKCENGYRSISFQRCDVRMYKNVFCNA